MEKDNNPFLIYGLHSIETALDEGKIFSKIFIQKDARNDRLGKIISQLKKEAIPFSFVPREKMSRLCSGNHQGIGGYVSPVEYHNLEEVVREVVGKGNAPLILIPAGVTDVRNLGAMARSAECFGVDAIYLPTKGGVTITSEAMQASAGALGRIKVCREINFMEGIQYLKDSGIQLVACTEHTKNDVFGCDLSIPTAIIMGEEGEGIQQNLLDLCDAKVRIGMSGKTGSLNVSVATGIILHETFKQRNPKV